MSLRRVPFNRLTTQGLAEAITYGIGGWSTMGSFLFFPSFVAMMWLRVPVPIFTTNPFLFVPVRYYVSTCVDGRAAHVQKNEYTQGTYVIQDSHS